MDGQNLKDKLLSAKVVFADLAQRMEITPQTLNSCFNVKDVRSNTLERIAGALNVPMSFFYPEEGTHSTSINNSNVITGGTNTHINMSVSTQTDTDIEEAEVIEEFETAPIIPSTWLKRTDFDVMQMTEDQWENLSHSRVAIAGTPIDAWYVMPDNSMSSDYLKGDKVGLSRQPTKKIIPGCVYGIDTNTHGMLIRMLYEANGGYRAQAINNDIFPDFFISEEETISLSKVIVLVRL